MSVDRVRDLIDEAREMLAGTIRADHESEAARDLIGRMSDALAAAGVVLPAPSADREKMIDEARRAAKAVFLATDAAVADDLSRILNGLADTLAASAPVDEAKLAEAIDSHEMTVYGADSFSGCRGCGELYVDTGIGIVQWFSAHRARELHKFLEGGE